jgi:hypothetical protein
MPISGSDDRQNTNPPIISRAIPVPFLSFYSVQFLSAIPLTFPSLRSIVAQYTLQL